MCEQEYTKEELKKAMLNEACPKMQGFFSDLYDDFQSIDNMEIGETAHWFYRLNGTSFRTEDAEGFERDFRFWKKQVFKVFMIARIGTNKYRVAEININDK